MNGEKAEWMVMREQLLREIGREREREKFIRGIHGKI